MLLAFSFLSDWIVGRMLCCFVGGILSNLAYSKSNTSPK